MPEPDRDPAGDLPDGGPPRPAPSTYWLLPGRLLVGEYPGSASRADAMERLRLFLASGITCFVDLTAPWELPTYEGLLPFATPDGRRVEYLREPIPDHSIPADRETMTRVLAMIDAALAAGHVVYLHCRAGIGRSATVAGCWLAQRAQPGANPLEELQRCWRQSAKSEMWPTVPETEEQVEYVRDWWLSSTGPVSAVAASGPVTLEERVRGAFFGLAAGDSAGISFQMGLPAGQAWTQHTSLALCLAESLVELGRFDARDQMERYVRWQRDGYLAAGNLPRHATPDVARALANYHWRRQPMAGSHDPADRSTASLPRVLSAVVFALGDPAEAVALAGECSRTTHQSPIVIDACRYYAAMLAGALRGAPPADVLGPGYEPLAGLWKARPLKPEIAELAEAGAGETADAPAAEAADVVHALANARLAVKEARDFDDALHRACIHGTEPALDASVAGTLMGALHGERIIPRARMQSLARADLLESIARRMCERLQGAGR